MAHYILSDDFDFDSIIIKSIDFDNEKAVLKLVFTYNDGNTLEASVDLSDTFASIEYVATSINNALKSYSTTTEVGVLIANALGEYDKSSVVTTKINTAISNALTSYYTKSEVDNKVANKNVSSVEATYETSNNNINIKVSQNDGTSANGNVAIPNGSNSASGLISASQTRKLNNIEDGANKYVLPTATETALGGVKAVKKDDNYTVDCRIGDDGKLYVTEGLYTLPVANSTTLGGVKPIPKTSEQTVSVGVDKEGGLWVVAGLYELKTATATTLGGVKIGSGINVSSDGTISAETYSLPTASTTTLGGVKIGSGINISNGVISAQTYTLPKATTTTLGGVKIANGLSVDTDGDLSVSVDGTTIDEGQTGLEVKTDGESIQAGANGLEVKVDNSTIKVGDNGLEANVSAKIFPDFDNVLYSGESSSTIEVSGYVLPENAIVFIGGVGKTVGSSGYIKINDVMTDWKYESYSYMQAPSILLKKGTILKIQSQYYFLAVGLTD